MTENTTPDSTPAGSAAPDGSPARDATTDTAAAPPVAAAPTAQKPSTALALAALIVGVVAFLCAVIPGLSFVAWVPALVATALAIVALATKRAGRGMSIAAVILGPLALLVAIIVSFGTIAAGLSDALPPTETKVESATGQGSEESEPEAAPEENAVGTRANPAPAGSTVVLSDISGEVYEIEFGVPTLDANAIIKAENMFNDPAEKGFQYVILPVTFTYVGTETGTPWIDTSFAFVSAAGTTHDSSSTFVVAPKPITDINELYPGASASGNFVAMVPSADIEKGTWTVSALFGENYFVAVK